MKKVAVCVFAAMVVSIGVTGAAAANQLAGCAFVDADGNGICDTCGTVHGASGWGRHYVDADGDGVCDNQGTGYGRSASASVSARGQGHGGCGGRGRHGR